MNTAFRYSNLLLVVVFLFASCANNRFTKQKYTKLKSIELKGGEQGNQDITTGNKAGIGVSEIDTNPKLAVEESVSPEVNPSYTNDILDKEVNDDRLVSENVSDQRDDFIQKTTTPFQQFKRTNPKKLLDEEEKKREDKRFMTIIIWSVLAILMLVVGMWLMIGFLYYGEIIFLIFSFIVTVFAAITGIIVAILGKKLRSNYTTTKGRIVGLVGGILGWVIFGFAMAITFLSILNLLFI